MKLLNIFALEDVNEQDLVISLPEGEHVIGRGVTLNCNDKRISRKHALIDVGKEMVTIKAVHVNPCFFKAADGNSITILPKDTAVELNDGDQFALLADLFWFRVRVIVGENAVKCDDFKKPEDISCNKILIVNGNTNTVAPPSECEIIISPGNNPSSKGKRSLEENLKGTCKRQRITDANKNEPSTSKSPDKNTLQSEDMSDRPSSPSGLNLLLNTSRNLEQNIDSNQLINNLNYILEEDYGIANNEEEKKTATDNLKLNNMSHLNVPQNNEENSATKKSEYSETEERDKSKEERLEVISDDDDDIIDGNVAQIEETNKGEEIKKEKAENSETGDKSETEQKQNDKGETSNSDALQVDKIKKENAGILQNIISDDGDAKTNNDQNEPSCSKDNPTDQQNKKKSRRERCWYAHMCYRKNPLHRVNFSHPGDDDFLSDPDDDRPVCPFGDACYRTNLTHRRDYKHTSRPAPKPNGGNDNDGTGAPAKRKAAMKKLYPDYDSAEDDYDYNDPFIDDASSDEFQLSSDEDDSTDWEDSQKVDEESQETRRMLKEAKRFTKIKKKKQ